MNPEERDRQPHDLPPDIEVEILEHRESPRARKWWVGGWLAPLLVAGGTLFWCLLIYWLIGDRPMNWKYGVVPYVPSESIFTTERARGEVVPPQVELPLPEETEGVDEAP